MERMELLFSTKGNLIIIRGLEQTLIEGDRDLYQRVRCAVKSYYLDSLDPEEFELTIVAMYAKLWGTAARGDDDEVEESHSESGDEPDDPGSDGDQHNRGDKPPVGIPFGKAPGGGCKQSPGTDGAGAGGNGDNRQATPS